MRAKGKERFFFRYLLRGLVWLMLIVLLFIVLKDNPYIRDLDWLNQIAGTEWLIYLIFLTSEVVFGIIPPEFFMIWSIHHGISDSYILNVSFLSILSYGAGVLGYYLGRKFSTTALFDRVFSKYLSQYRRSFNRFSGFILFVGAVTPLPFSGVCMLVGTVNYPRNYFLLITLSRFLRFIVYGYLIYHVDRI